MAQTIEEIRIDIAVENPDDLTRKVNGVRETLTAQEKADQLETWAQNRLALQQEADTEETAKGVRKADVVAIAQKLGLTKAEMNTLKFFFAREPEDLD